MTRPASFEAVRQRYRTHLQSGSDPASKVGWGTERSQQKRFDVLMQIGDLDGASILDVGCGLGAFYGALLARGAKVDYTGVDLVPEMVSQARASYGRDVFHAGTLQDMLKHGDGFDYIFASGIFCFDTQHGAQGMYDTVQEMFHAARLGVAFNTLCDSLDDGQDDEFRANAAETVKFCAALTKKYALRHDYHPGDFTIYLHKEEAW